MSDFKNRLNQYRERVERQQAEETTSKQPRFGGDVDPNRVFGSVLKWVKTADIEDPTYQSDSRDRDAWLREFWPQEPYLSGVLNSIVAVDKNRGWELVGGRNQVIRYRRILTGAEGGLGWRHYFGLQSLAYYTADMGSVNEVGRAGEGGPLRDLYHVDPARCVLTGDWEQPLEYTPAGSHRPQEWLRDDYFRVSSMPNTDEVFNGLGYCFVSRALELAKIMVAVYQHDQEQLGAKAPQGLLILQNIDQGQWETAMQARESELEAKERQWFGGVAVLAQAGVEQADAKLVALSSLPSQFDRQVFTEMLMYGYALMAGYDPGEFWPVRGGGLDTTGELEVQHRKATGKGGLDFVLGYQSQLEPFLPDSLHFGFEERDAEGEILDAELQSMKAKMAKELYETARADGQGLLTRQQALSLLAEEGVIPREWTEAEEEEAASDVEKNRLAQTKERLLQKDTVWRSIYANPDRPIVRYRWPLDRMQILWDRGSEMLRPQVWRGVRVLGDGDVMRLPDGRRSRVERQADDDVLFEGEDFEITTDDVERAIAEARERVGDEFADILENEPFTANELSQFD